MKALNTRFKALLVCLCAVILTATLSTPCTAQLEDDQFFYGFRVGPVLSRIDDIRTTIIPSAFSVETYTADSEYRTGFTVGAFVHHTFKDSKLAIEPHLAYTMSGGDFKYSDIQDLEYTIEFKYQYVNLGLAVKWYTLKGLAFTLGPDLGLNIGNSRIFYSSNMPELGPDLQIQSSLREVLKAKSDLGLLMGVSYDFDFGLMFDARYRLGFTDVIETQSNGFNFIENDNWSSGIQFTLGYAIPFYGY